MCVEKISCFSCTVVTHAENYLKIGEAKKAISLLDIILQDKVRKLSKKHGMETASQIDVMIDKLAERSIVPETLGQRLKKITAFRQDSLKNAKNHFPAEDCIVLSESARELRTINH